jgi:hypothetical protein
MEVEQEEGERGCGVESRRKKARHCLNGKAGSIVNDV